MNTTPAQLPSPAIAPFPMTITMSDGSTERIVIKPLSITKLYKWLYLAKEQNEPSMVALVCDKPVDWIDTLEIETYAKIAKKCHEIVFPQAIRLAKGAPEAAALIAPVIQKNELGLKVIAILSTGYGSLSPKPQPSESAAATSSASPTPTQATGSAQSSPSVTETKPAGT